jgi:DNA invertase Pin-like site-specific DNA recombinase
MNAKTKTGEAVKRAVLYARKSTDLQSDATIPDQLRHSREVAERMGYEVAYEFADEGESGAAIGNRPGVMKSRDLALAGKVDCVIVTDLSRLSRSARDTMALTSKLQAHGVRVIESQGGYDSSRKGSKLEAGFKGLMNEHARDNTRDKVQLALTGKAKRGEVAGLLPYGYRTVIDPVTMQKSHTPCEQRAPIVREIFKLYDGGTSPQQIANTLNRRGVPSPFAHHKKRAASGRWSEQGVRCILRNDTYTGRYTYNKREVTHDDGDYSVTRRTRPQREWLVTERPDLRIVDDALFERCRKKLEARKLAGVAAKGRGPRYLLSSLLKCEACGSALICVGANKKNPSGYYKCATAHKQKACPNTVTIPRHAAEAVLLQPIIDELRSPKGRAAGLALLREHVKANPPQSASANAELQKLDGQIAALEAMVASRTVDAATMEPAIAAAYKKRDALKRQQRTGVIPAANLFKLDKLFNENCDRLLDLLTGDDVLAARAGLLDTYHGDVMCRPGKCGKHLEAVLPAGRGVANLCSAAVGDGLHNRTQEILSSVKKTVAPLCGCAQARAKL